MQIFQLKNIFLEALKEEYPLQEVNSFFNLLTSAYLNLDRLQIALKPEKEVSEEDQNKFDAAIWRLQNHEPVQYIIGETNFFGLNFKVDKNTLIPRPETEELVAWILEDIASEAKNIKILDIGTGSGCIVISLASKLPNSQISALDISEKALEIARFNAENNKVEVEFFQGDVLELRELPQQYDVIVSNPPYVRELEKKEMHRNVLEHEPESALYVEDNDPLIFYRKITEIAAKRVNEGGKLYFEINQYLAYETEDLLKKNGFKTELRKDIFGNFRMLKAEK